ncbi:hypothetical protein [Flexibacterium corallicola]|uniref:hypothetical protein n=1 Tax=Flexibacterium corallicola TaxID=3037259 RepID=UPI00286F2D24|nr:hypothetical protein [Pseudovibrio sp. M1P-2-3]
MRLSPPSFILFLLALALGICSLLVYFSVMHIPVVSGNAYPTMGIAWLLLVLGNMLRGL